MDKLYSKNALIFKALFCALLAPLFVIFSAVISIEDIFLYILASTVPIGCLYTIPFWLTLKQIIKYRVVIKAKYIAYDSIVCIVPAVMGVLCSEIVYAIFNEKTLTSGVITTVFAAIFFIISLLFWLLYFIFSKKK